MSREKFKLALHRNGLTAHHHRVGRTHAAGIGGATGSEHAQNHGTHHHRALSTLLRHHAGNVALRDVAEFMRQHRSQFVCHC